MVLVSRLLLRRSWTRGSPDKRFLDSVRVYVRGGAGGMGLPRYGGIGGKGGDVIVTAMEGASLKSLIIKNPTKRFIAGNGENSNKHRLLGAPGQSKRILVPPGITVINDFDHVLGELNTDGDSVVVAQGGPGGSPATQFSGQAADPVSITLDLKLLADMGFVGFPNAGKSTLLRAISNAKPAVASYPFTTVTPIIGVMEYPDKRQIKMADLPGLIEGAHMNFGMGHKFLKHIERTKMLLMVVDIEGFQLGPQYPNRSCLDTVILLNKELEMYRDDLLDKPAMLVINKMDLNGAQEKYNKVKDKLKHLEGVLGDYPEYIRPERTLQFSEIMTISAAKDRDSVMKLKQRIRELLEFHALLEEDDVESETIAKLKAQMLPSGPQML